MFETIVVLTYVLNSEHSTSFPGFVISNIRELALPAGKKQAPRGELDSCIKKGVLLSIVGF